MAAEADPLPLIDPVDALKQIQALGEDSCETTCATRAEPIIQMIREILDKALPPTPKRRQRSR